jgi:hypothetical protein
MAATKKKQNKETISVTFEGFIVEVPVTTITAKNTEELAQKVLALINESVSNAQLKTSQS